MVGHKPMICVAIVSGDAALIKKAGPPADLFEVRIDLIGKGWREVAGQLKKPWLACNRRADEGGKWKGGEASRISELMSALDLGAAIVDIELAAPGLDKIIKEIRGRAECLVSHHDLEGTPSLWILEDLVKRQLAAGADICKVVTTARCFADNLAVLRLIRRFRGDRIAAFAMGEAGQISRILAPLAGGYFTYASLEEGKESAAGQLTADQLREIYGILEDDR